MVYEKQDHFTILLLGKKHIFFQTCIRCPQAINFVPFSHAKGFCAAFQIELKIYRIAFMSMYYINFVNGRNHPVLVPQMV